jgi:hypothetical protein
LRSPACPFATSPSAAGEDDDPEARGDDGSVGDTDGDAEGSGIGSDDGGGRNGASMAPVVPSSSSFEPAVIAASVGSDARPTSIATINTYRRVGPEKPSARYTPSRRRRRTLTGGTSRSSFGSCTLHPSEKDQLGSASAMGVNDGCPYRQRPRWPFRAEVAVRKSRNWTNMGTDPPPEFPDCDRPDL